MTFVFQNAITMSVVASIPIMQLLTPQHTQYLLQSLLLRHYYHCKMILPCFAYSHGLLYIHYSWLCLGASRK